MFTKKSGIHHTPIDSFIGENLKVTGDVHFSNGLRIDGSIEANVSGATGEKSLLVLSNKGRICGTVQACDAIINGQVHGDLLVSGFLELQENARIVGNISYQKLQMACGAHVEGKLQRIDATTHTDGTLHAIRGEHPPESGSITSFAPA